MSIHITFSILTTWCWGSSLYCRYLFTSLKLEYKFHLEICFWPGRGNDSTSIVIYKVEITVCSLFIRPSCPIIAHCRLIDFPQKRWVFVTNSDILIPISLQQCVVDLRYFKQCRLWDQISLKYKRCTPSDCRDIGIKKFEFVAKT